MTLVTTRPAYEDHDSARCRRCGGLLAVDVGCDVFGEHSGSLFCLRCDDQPEALDRAGITAAVQAVVRASRGQR